MLPGGGNIEGCPRVRSAAAVIRQCGSASHGRHTGRALCGPGFHAPLLSTLYHTTLYRSLLKMLSVLAEAKVGCLSLSWQPAVEERHLTSLSSPPSRCHHPPPRVGNDDDDICSFSHAQHSVYGACKGINRWRRQKGADDDCLSASATPTLHKYIHIWDTNTLILILKTLFSQNYMSSVLHPPC